MAPDAGTCSARAMGQTAHAKALGICDAMQKERLTPNIITYDAAIGASEKCALPG